MWSTAVPMVPIGSHWFPQYHLAIDLTLMFQGPDDFHFSSLELELHQTSLLKNGVPSASAGHDSRCAGGRGPAQALRPWPRPPWPCSLGVHRGQRERGEHEPVPSSEIRWVESYELTIYDWENPGGKPW